MQGTQLIIITKYQMLEFICSHVLMIEVDFWHNSCDLTVNLTIIFWLLLLLFCLHILWWHFIWLIRMSVLLYSLALSVSMFRKHIQILRHETMIKYTLKSNGCSNSCSLRTVVSYLLFANDTYLNSANGISFENETKKTSNPNK